MGRRADAEHPQSGKELLEPALDSRTIHGDAVFLTYDSLGY